MIPPEALPGAPRPTVIDVMRTLVMWACARSGTPTAAMKPSAEARVGIGTRAISTL